MYQVNSNEQLRELSGNDLNFLETSGTILDDEEHELDDSGDGTRRNSTVRDLENILDKFEADTQLLLDNPNQLLNCKYNNLIDQTNRTFAFFCYHIQHSPLFTLLCFVPFPLLPLSPFTPNPSSWSQPNNQLPAVNLYLSNWMVM